MRLLKETISTFLDNITASKQYNLVIRRKLLNNESFQISPKIYVDNKIYRVARLGPTKISIKKRSVIELEGYLIIDEKGRIILDKNIHKRILPIYEIWYYKYVHSIFSPLVFNFPKLIDKQIETITNLEISIKSRKKREYSEELKQFGRSYTEVLKELDDQVLNHNIYAIAALRYTKEFINTEKDFFEKLSEENYNKIMKLSSSIRLGLINQNIVWIKRKETWTRFISEIKKIAQIKKLKRKKNKKFDAELLESFGLDTISLFIPIPYLGLAYTLMKKKYTKILKKTKEWYYKEIIEHKFGIDSIELHSKYNLKLMEKLNTLNDTLNNIDYSKIRSE